MDGSIIVALQRQISQGEADAVSRMALARTNRDGRRVDFCAGQLDAYRMILQTLDLAELPAASEHRRSA
jgi:hypothetical protein